MATNHLTTNFQKQAHHIPTKKILILLIITAIAFFVRLEWFSFVSSDYEIFLAPWYNRLKAGGGLFAIGQPIGDYTPAYIYILAALTYIPISSLHAIKLVSFAGDILLACFSFKIVSTFTNKPGLPVLSYAAVILLPTVLLNSGAWAQCDSLYACALMASVYCFIRGRPHAGMILYSVAFFFKLQSIFLFPLILMLLIKKKVKLRQLFYIPIAYVLSILPAAVAGRDIADLLTIYIRQTGTYEKLSLNAPNFYIFISESDAAYSKIGIAVFVCVLAVLLLYIWRTGFTATPRVILKFTMLLSVMVPFLLPHMHERYFYLADAFSVVYAFVNPRRWYVAPVVVGCSLSVYAVYLFGLSGLAAYFAAIPMFIILCLLFHDAIQSTVTPEVATHNRP